MKRHRRVVFFPGQSFVAHLVEKDCKSGVKQAAWRNTPVSDGSKQAHRGT